MKLWAYRVMISVERYLYVSRKEEETKKTKTICECTGKVRRAL